MIKFFKKQKPSATTLQSTQMSGSPPEVSVVDQIGALSGEIWQLLATQGPTTLGRVAHKVGCSREFALQAIGWLARENKISLAGKGKNQIVSLSNEELSRVA